MEIYLIDLKIKTLQNSKWKIQETTERERTERVKHKI